MRPPEKSVQLKIKFSYFLTKTLSEGAQKNRINEMVLLSTKKHFKMMNKKLITIHMCLKACLFGSMIDVQWRSQNAENATHVKGRLLDKAVILFNHVAFHNGNLFKGKNLLPEGANSFL